MNDIPMPKYDWGQPVRATVDLYNDGSFPDAGEDDLLVAEGGPGEVVQVGQHVDSGTVLYMVDFGVCVLGCTEDEIRPDGMAAPQPVAVAGTQAAG